MTNNHQIKTALISVSDKTGVVEFARRLTSIGIQIYSTGGTEEILRKNSISVKNISELTKFPEILDGRVKTLHPAVHAGLLAELDKQTHIDQLMNHNLISIDMLVCNLYPFEATLNNPQSTHEQIIENIDIGGPSMLRAAAKNYRWTAVVTNSKHYEQVLNYLESNNQKIPDDFRLQLAGEVFAHTAAYDSLISQYFNKQNNITFPETLTLSFNKAMDCRYGENPHQPAAVYGNFLEQFNHLHGKELSYNNIMDASSICELMLEFEAPTVAIVKHTNPCGVASAENLIEAYKLAYSTDTVSPYGGIIATNGKIDLDFAKEVHSLFSELIIATDFTHEAMELLSTKKNRRLITVDYKKIRENINFSFRSIPGGVLYQRSDDLLASEDMKVVTKRHPTPEELDSLLFAWKVVKHVKSNAIVYASGSRTIGVGAGQMSRVDSSRIAVEKAKAHGLDLAGSVFASDAFLPFADALMEAVNAGSTAVIQPGGAIRDEEVIEVANKHNIAMLFTGMRHFRH